MYTDVRVSHYSDAVSPNTLPFLRQPVVGQKEESPYRLLSAVIRWWKHVTRYASVSTPRKGYDFVLVTPKVGATQHLCLAGLESE
jgi:hypothetical protein